jgi:hypothetical protein
MLSSTFDPGGVTAAVVTLISSVENNTKPQTTSHDDVFTDASDL